MEKEEYRKAFEAGRVYWGWVQTDEPMLHKPIATKRIEAERMQTSLFSN